MSKTAGAAAGSTLALALLVCGCVFAAMAGPALSLHTRTQAFHQTLAGLGSTTKAVQVTANWSSFTGPLVQYGIGNPSQNMTVGRALPSQCARSAAASPRCRSRSRPTTGPA